MVSSILTVWADNDELTGLLFVKPVTSQRLKGTATLPSGSLATQHMQVVLWSTGREYRGRLLDVFLLIHERKETALGCFPGWTALKQLALVLLKLGVLLPTVSVEAYAQDPAF